MKITFFEIIKRQYWYETKSGTGIFIDYFMEEMYCDFALIWFYSTKIRSKELAEVKET